MGPRVRRLSQIRKPSSPNLMQTNRRGYSAFKLHNKHHPRTHTVADVLRPGYCDYSVDLPAALAFFHLALAAAASLARHAALRFRFLPAILPARGVAPDPGSLPRRGLEDATLRSPASSDSSLVRRSLITMARRSCFTVRSANEFIRHRITSLSK